MCRPQTKTTGKANPGIATTNLERRQLTNKPNAPSTEPELKPDKPNVQPAPRAGPHMQTNAKKDRQYKACKATAKPATNRHPNSTVLHQNMAAHQGTMIKQIPWKNKAYKMTMPEVSKTDSDEVDNGSTSALKDTKTGIVLTFLTFFQQTLLKSRWVTLATQPNFIMVLGWVENLKDIE